ncbi:ABC transporter ATP-binding protein [Bombiscardovia nodaiensis]|uniref:ABC transporter ATP-binding protein n=1 Tax=Bombiscardovia nodaiensis TaxID=2932181 RepID=A0ABM8B7V1_9BIFI|nr:ABC transporter ATP-binding protein [Bombiscardovia nodaiensis]
MSVLELDKLTYHYGKYNHQVLKGITAAFEEGQMASIMGRSGAGKTTLLSLVSGLDTASGGRVLYRGQDVAKLDRDNYRARSVGLVFQGYNLLTNASALDNIVLSMQISGVKSSHKKADALALLAKLGIDEETAKRKVLRMSGGEQQRVGIARALAHDPDVIIADEPTGNLDEESEQIIMEILTGLAHQEGKCVLVVTHSQAVANYADQVWRLRDGKLEGKKRPPKVSVVQG